MLAPISPNHLQPSPSPTQTTFSSLRKMPSSIFHRNTDNNATKRSTSSSKPFETINSLAPKEKKKSRMGLGILGWGASSHDKVAVAPAVALAELVQQPMKPIETVRSVGEAFVRAQAERSETVQASMRAASRVTVPSSMHQTEPLNDVEAPKSKPRLTGVAGIARRASNLSLRPKLSPTLPSSNQQEDRRAASDPVSKPTTQRRTSNSSSIISNNSSAHKRPVKARGGVAGVWERIAGGKKRSVKEDIESLMQPVQHTPPQVVKLKDGTSVLSISRPSFEGILSRPLLYDENASYEPYQHQQPYISTIAGLPRDNVTNLPPPLRARSRGASSVRPAAGIWESVVGDLAHQGVEDGFAPLSTIEAAFNKPVPKRKSLTGLFGHFGSPHPEAVLEEAQEEVLATPSRQARDRKVRSEQLGLGGSVKKLLESTKNQVDIDHVVCVTDSLCDLVTRFDLSATPSPASKCTPAHSHKRSPDVPEDVTSSPTPMRRAASMGSSTLLATKNSGSPLKLFVKGGISPFKIAMSRATALRQRDEAPAPVRALQDNIFAPSNFAPGDASSSIPDKRRSRKVQPRNDLPSVFQRSQLPEASRPGVEAETIGMHGANVVVDELVGMGMTMGPAFARDGMNDSDVPRDLRVMLLDKDKDHTDISLASSLDATITMGLPPMPPADRISPRRPGPQLALLSPPKAPLPPSPAPQLRVHAPQLSMGLAFKECVRESFMSDGVASIFSDEYTMHGSKRKSFDFTGEFAELNESGQRTSFLEQLQAMGENPLLSLALGSATATPVDDASLESPVTPTEADERPNKVSIGALNRNFKFGKASSSPVPGAGFSPQWSSSTEARQMMDSHVPHSQLQEAPYASSASLPVLPTPVSRDTLCPPGKSSTHARDESLFSIASMSSLGTVINTGIAGVFTNVFDADFARIVKSADANRGTAVGSHLGQQAQPQLRARRSHTRDNESIDSCVSTFSFHAPGEARWMPGHRRSSSTTSHGSTDSRNMAIDNAQPSVSMYNRNRNKPSFSRSHRQYGSTDSQSSMGSISYGLGRPDWAAHRRNRSSVGSARSSISIARLGRPGLGDRMFGSDRGRGGYLPSIMASPAGDSAPEDNPRDSMASYDSLFDDSSTSRDSLLDGNSTAFDSIFDVSGDHAKSSSINSDSFFGASSQCESLPSSGFALKGLRPLSTVSTLSGQAEDTFVNFSDSSAKRPFALQTSPSTSRGNVYSQKVSGHGRDSSASDASICSVALGSRSDSNGFSRPRPAAVRSQSGQRRRPPTLNILDHSSSDISMLMSPNSSNGSTFGSSIDLGRPDVAMRAKPRGAGHFRGVRSKSSAGVNVQATILEEHSSRFDVYGSVPDLTTDTGGESDASSFLPAVSSIQKLPQPFSWIESDDGKHSRAVRGWREWEREADDVYRNSKSSWADSESSRSAIADFSPPVSPIGIAHFIAKSTEDYQPLAFQPLGGRIRHRRSSSLNNSRAKASPYALPLPRQIALPTKNKSSLPLPTKFERTNSATSSVFSFAYSEDEVAVATQPPSAVFAKFVIPPAAARSHASPPPVLRDLDPLSPFQLPGLQAFPTKPPTANGKQNDTAAARSRVTSNARRQALGWGRRRTSDGGPPETNTLAKSIRTTLGGSGESRSLNADKENDIVRPATDSVKPLRVRSRQVSNARNKPATRLSGSIRV